MIVKKNPFDLELHRLNYVLYGREPVDEELVESIKKHGILEPVVITKDGKVISGHRRLKAAMNIQPVPQVPCRVISFPPGQRGLLEEQEAIIEFNRQRRKTDQQIAREGELLEKIYSERAEERKLKNLKPFQKTHEKHSDREISKEGEQLEEIYKEPANKRRLSNLKQNQEEKKFNEFISKKQEERTDSPTLSPLENDQKIESEAPEKDEGLEYLDKLKKTTSDNDTQGKTSEKVAKKVGVSKSKYEQIQRVRRARDSEDPQEREIYKRFENGEITANKAENLLKELKKQREEPEPVKKGPIDKVVEPLEDPYEEMGIPSKDEVKQEMADDLEADQRDYMKQVQDLVQVEDTDPLADIDFEDHGKTEERVSLPKNTVKKLIQMTLMDFKDSRVTQVSPEAVTMIQEHGQTEMMRLAIEGAKYARRENRKTIKEEDVRRVLGIKAY